MLRTVTVGLSCPLLNVDVVWFRNIGELVGNAGYVGPPQIY